MDEITKVIIVEDEVYIRKGLIELIGRLNKGLVIVAECGSVQEALVVTKITKPDLIFLDINLPDGDAFGFLEQVNHSEISIIFVTAHEKYALKALKKGAIDYILKPVDIEELENAIDKALFSISSSRSQFKHSFAKSDQQKLILSLQDSFQVILLKELMYCVSDKGYTTFHLSNGKSVLASKHLKEFENKLPASVFVRPHQSYFVNLNYIDQYEKIGVIVLKTGEKIPVSTRKRDEFLSIFLP